LYKTPANKAYTGRWGFHRIFKHFSLACQPGQAGFGFFSAPKQNPRPPQHQYPYRAHRGRKPLGFLLENYYVEK